MKNGLKLIAAVAFALSASSAVAAPETYVIDGAHTFPRFSYSHLGYSTQLSRFSNTSGKVMFDKAARRGEVDIVIDMNSVDTGFEKFNEHLRSADFFETAKFPKATFKSTRVTFNGNKPFKIDGDLTIKGITRPVTLTVSSFQAMPHPMLKKDAIGANAHTVIKRSDFGAGMHAPHVSDDVRIDIAIEAVKE